MTSAEKAAIVQRPIVGKRRLKVVTCCSVCGGLSFDKCDVCGAALCGKCLKTKADDSAVCPGRHARARR